MTQGTYSLSWILPIIRSEVKARGNFQYSTFAQQVWFALEKHGVEGVVRTPPDRPSSSVFQPIPLALQTVASEAFWYLMRRGYVSPAPRDDQSGSLDLYRYNVTERGLAWFAGGEPPPGDIAGYMKLLHQRVPNIDPVIDQYVAEALRAFNEELVFAAAVMLGAASEKALYLLADDMVGALNNSTHKQRLQSLLGDRKLNPLLLFIRDRLVSNRSATDLPLDGFTTQLMALFDAIRTQRNDAVHPTNVRVSSDSVRLLIASLPYSLSKVEEVRLWLRANQQSLD